MNQALFLIRLFGSTNQKRKFQPESKNWEFFNCELMQKLSLSVHYLA